MISPQKRPHATQRRGRFYTPEILQLTPDLPVLILPAWEDISYPDRAIECGAKGFIAKTTSLNRLFDAVTAILGGGTWFCPNALEMKGEVMINEGGALNHPSV